MAGTGCGFANGPGMDDTVFEANRGERGSAKNARWDFGGGAGRVFTEGWRGPVRDSVRSAWA